MALGLLGTALAGAMAGGGEAGLKFSLEEAKNEAAMKRDEALARIARETHEANAQTDLRLLPEKKRVEVEAENKKLHPLSPGASLASGEGIKFTAPEKQLPAEQLNSYKAYANQLNAEAEAIRSGLKYGSKDKEVLPKVVVTRNPETGEQSIVDSNSGAMGIITQGMPAKKGETRWFGPNDPDQPSTQPTIQWQHNGKILQGGLADLYPAMRERIESGRPAADRPGSGVDWSKFGVGAEKPKGAQPAQTAPRAQPQQGTSEKMVSGMSEAALRQAAQKNDDIGRAAKARLVGIERDRAEAARASEEAAGFPFPR